MKRLAMICAATALAPAAVVAQTVSPPTQWEDVPDARLNTPASPPAPPAGVTWQRPATPPAPLPPVAPRALPPAPLAAPPPLPPIPPRATPPAPPPISDRPVPAPPAVAARPLPPSSAPSAPPVPPAAGPTLHRQAEARPAPPPPAAHAERAHPPRAHVETRRVERIHPGWDAPADHPRGRYAENRDRDFDDEVYAKPRHHGDRRWKYDGRDRGWASREGARYYDHHADDHDYGDDGEWDDDIAWHDGYPVPPAPAYPHPYWGYGYYGYAPGGMVTITETITTTKPRIVETKRVVKHRKAPPPKSKTKRRAPSKLYGERG